VFRLAARHGGIGGTAMTWLLAVALFGGLGVTVTYVCWILHATLGRPVCEQRALLRPAWKLVRALCGRSLWTKVLRTVDRAFINERVKAAAS